MSKIYKNIDSQSVSLYTNILVSYILKGGSLLISMILTPLFIAYFNNQVVLGGWFTILSILNWIMYFDFGVGNGLRNLLTKSITEDDINQTNKLISSTFIIMLFIVLMVFCSGAAVLLIFDSNDLLNIPAVVLDETTLFIALFILFLGTLTSFYLNLTTSIMHSIQKSGWTGLFPLVSNILILSFIIFYKSESLNEKFIYLSLVYSVSISLPLIIATFYIFKHDLRGFSPKIRYFDKRSAYYMVKLGGLFFWIQVALLFINSTDQILITHMYGAPYVVEYQLYHKIFYLLITMYALITNPLWASVSKANSQKNYEWITKLKSKLYVYAMIFTLFSILLVFINQFAFDLWLQSETIEINIIYSISFAIYSIVMIWLFSITAIANGLSLLKAQLIATTVGMILKIPLVLVSNLLFDSWITVVIVNVLIMIFNLIFNIIYVEIKMKKFKKENSNV